MLSPPATFRTGRWRMALLLSLILHAFLATPVCWLTILSSPRIGLGDGSTINTRIGAPAGQISLIPFQPRPASKKPTPTPIIAQVAAASPAASGVTSPKGTISSLPFSNSAALPHHSAGEEQETAGILSAGEAGGGTLVGQPSREIEGSTFFGIRARGTKIVYVIDRSASMGLDGALAAAKRELVASLDRLPSSVRFQVIVYNRTAEPLRIGRRMEWAAATPECKSQVRSLMKILDAEGGTEHLGALKRALLLRPDVIYFLTDAADLRVEQLRAVRLLNRGQTILHAVELRSGRPAGNARTLESLARENGGIYRAVQIER